MRVVQREASTFGLTPVTEQPMMRPCRRTPRYHVGPMRFILTSANPALVNHCRHPTDIIPWRPDQADTQPLSPIGAMVMP